MTGKTISTYIHATVTVGVGGYTSPLSITSAGRINPSYEAYGAVGLILAASGSIDTITNSGAIYGGYGAYGGGAGGIAVELTSGFSFVNKGVIGGASGGNSQSGQGQGGQGGIAVLIEAQGVFTNSGQINGGSGAYGYAGGGGSGYGVDFETSATLTNSGTIRGGTADNGGAASRYGRQGGYGIFADREDLVKNTGFILGGNGAGDQQAGGGGGMGVLITYGTLNNAGLIMGGAGGSTSSQYGVGGGGGTGAYLFEGSSGVNSGKVIGGSGNYGHLVGGDGGVGVYVQNYSTMTNSATITGGDGGIAKQFAGDGGIGMVVDSYSTASNNGVINGGVGGAAYAYYGTGGGGGVGVLIDRSSFTNTGKINGGASGATPGFKSVSYRDAAGGYGLLALNGVITNSGVITGGVGGEDYENGGTAGAGGAGISLAGARFTNNGTIAGGIGGYAPQSEYNNAYGGQGGAGALVSAGATLVNNALIRGGTGGANVYGGATGGDGVIIDGGVFTNAGTVKAGYGGVTQGRGANGDAVFFEAAGTLIAAPGAKFVGNVVSTLASGSVLELTGTSSIALTGIGTQFVGINLISFATGASRVLEGDKAGFKYDEIGGFAARDTLVLDGFTAVTSYTYFQTRFGRIIFENSTGGYDIVNMTNFLAKDLKVTTGGGKTTMTGLGTVATVLGNGASEFVRSGGTASATLDKGAVEEILGGGTAAVTTIAGGEMFLEIGAQTSGSIAFSGTGGGLNIESVKMPTAEITGFISGDGITLSGVAYNPADKVAVKTAGTVSIMAPGATYNLKIAGATVGETDFHFASGSILTTTRKSPDMAFLTPPATARNDASSRALPGLETIIHEIGHTAALISGTQIASWRSQQTVSVTSHVGAALNPLFGPQNSLAAPVTLHSS